MKYIFFIAVMIIVIYSLSHYKMKPNKELSDIYDNARFIKVLIITICAILAFILSFFIKQNN